MESPQVSVICLCYNHVRFVKEAIDSALRQTHGNIQLIVVDDASTDGSADLIRQHLENLPDVIFLALDRNLGNCRAFNEGWALATGTFVIDLAADDVLFPSRIAEAIEALDAAGHAYGVHYSDAEIISETGQIIGLHSDKFPHAMMPEGDIYKEVIGRYFINSPTMMIRREVMESLGGYDSSLAYEDFDFWVRSSRTFLYCYTSRPLIKRRLVGNSMSRQQYKRNSGQLASTFRVCLKIKTLNKNREEDKALRKRIWYESRKSFAVGELRLVLRYMELFFSVLLRKF